MVVVMSERASEAQIDAVISRLIELGMDGPDNGRQPLL